MIEAERTPGFLHLLQMTGGASWLHMCIHHRETEGFLSSATGLDKLIAAAMVSEDTRSRLRVHGQGVMVLLKAMHLRADGVGHPEDMVSMRIWIDERRVITTREVKLPLEMGVLSFVQNVDKELRNGGKASTCGIHAGI